jgi:hypothetical protein
VQYRHVGIATVGLLALSFGVGPRLAAQPPAEKSNMELVGFDDLQARSAYQPVIRRQRDRWIAYIGHHRRSRQYGRREPSVVPRSGSDAQ